VSWADRIAYVCHDFEDAVHAGIVVPDQLPAVVRDRCGTRRSRQLHAFIDAVVAAVRATGTVAMTEPLAEALSEFRRFNYDHIYMRPASLAQNESVIAVLQALVEHFGEHPDGLPRADASVDPPGAGSAAAFRDAVTYVGGMTDRYAFARAIELLDWPEHRLPVGIA
jgi:dGTPase